MTRSAGRLLVTAAAPLGAACLLYVLLPRRANLRSFDPAEVARLETAMWFDYYHHNYGQLFLALYRVNREQYRFSPWQSGRLAILAGLAAKRFQPTRSRAEAQRALPLLESYYRIIRIGTRERFDPLRAANLELDWWQLRREDKTPAEYGGVVAQTFSEVYGVENEDLRQAALLRAEMMAYRDARAAGRMKAEDWRYIEENLARAYELLKRAVGLEAGR